MNEQPLSLSPHPPPPKIPLLLPQQQRMRMMKMIHSHPLLPLMPLSQCVAAKSLIVVPPNINYTVSYEVELD